MQFTLYGGGWSKPSGITTIGKGGQSPPRFSGVNKTLIGGVASVQEFCRWMKGVLGGPGESPCWTLTSLLPSPWSTRLLSISCLLRGEESYDSTRLSSYSYVMTYRFKSVSKSESSLPIISLSVMSSIAVLIKIVLVVIITHVLRDS